MDDTDLRGLDFATAREYLMAFATDAKRLGTEIGQAREELATWEKRAALALEKGRTDLETAARAKASEIAQRVADREAEKAELETKLRRMKEKLPGIRASERSVDADLLLAELQMMTGTLLDEDPGTGAPVPGTGTGQPAAPRSVAATEADLRKLEAESAAEAALAELKRKAGLA